MDTRRLQLDRTHLIDLVRDPRFFTDCPEFAHLQAAAVASLQVFDDSAGRRCCGGDFNAMRAVVDAIFTQLRSLQQTDPSAIERVRQHLATKKGYIPRPLVVYYRRGRTGQIGKLTV